jgi:hypothetical protein
MTNPVIQYTSRTYSTIMADINSISELKDKPEWWKKFWAGVGDALSLMLNAQANNSYLETSFTESATDRLLALIDYQRSARTTSSGIILFYIKRTATFPITLEIDEQIANSQGGTAVSSMRFEGRSVVTITAIQETFTASAGTDILTVARAYYTGDLVRLTSTGSLPSATGGGLAEDTDYYVIYVSSTKICLARTLALALAGTAIDITGAGSGTHTIHLYSYPVTMYQQRSVSALSVGSSDGITEFQTFDLPDKNILPDTLVVSVGGDTYTDVDSFVYSLPSDKHYRFVMKSDDSCSIRFGNGDGASAGYALIPPAFSVVVSYASGGGLISNITLANSVNIYSGGNSDVDFVSNPGSLTGGNDRESLTVAKRIAPILLKTRDRFITVADGEALAINYGGIARCKVVKNVYGVGSCQVIIVPYGGGSPSGALKTALQTYLIDKSILESIDVRVVDPVYSTVNVVSDLKVASGYSSSLVKSYYELSVRLFFSAITYQIQEVYTTLGISSAVDLINSTWSLSFTSAAYVQIQRLLEVVTPVNFNDTIQISEFYGIVNSYVDGVDYCTISVPSFPVSLAANEITEIGTITTTLV